MRQALDWSRDPRAAEAAAHIASLVPDARDAKWGIILGSGLTDALPPLEGGTQATLAGIPHLQVPGIPGQGDRLLAGSCRGATLVALEGRPHLYQGLGMDELTMPVRVLAELGVRHIISTCAAGGLNPAYEKGDLMVVRDHINMMGANPLRGLERDGMPAFLDLADAYDPETAERAAALGNMAGVRVAEGVYAAVAGPSFETSAEMRALRLIGADAVGMSLVPETLTARWLGLKMTAICCITNVWDMRQAAFASHLDVIATAGAAAPALAGILEELLSGPGGAGEGA
ncbi:MAG: purine-nucleoside phosphorylase [Candidatus Geothermincolia bacterium]